jgi:CAAX prenyl protease-like protein
MARALLLPMIALLASILLISAGSGEFEWLYPVKVITTGAVLLYFWSTYRFHQPWLRLEPIVIGAAVFLVWMALVPADSARTTQMASHLSQVTPAVAVVWLIFRFIGSSLVVPLAEELAFRGYLLSRLSRQEPHTSASLAFGWVPFLATSFLFGLVHGDWLAGTIAGMAYALARYRHGRVGDAALAHMTTNVMLSTYVLVTQQWSYW